MCFSKQYMWFDLVRGNIQTLVNKHNVERELEGIPYNELLEKLHFFIARLHEWILFLPFHYFLEP